MGSVGFAKYVMKKFQKFPTFDIEKVGERNEVFHHDLFLKGSTDQQKKIMLKSSQSKYENEFNFPFDKYFGISLLPFLKDKTVLDLGCFTGGRSAAWFERYQMKHLSGIDINDIYIEAATQYAALKNISADYRKGTGEKIPYADNQFDAVITYDVFEHVRDLRKTMAECQRVLKPEGKLIVVFPSYYQPIEHHLGLVSNMPGLQFMFSGKTLIKAYYEILKERGEKAYWYNRDSPDLEKWEKGNTINGTTYRQFRNICIEQDWKKIFQSRKPIGSVGRKFEKNKLLKGLMKVFTPLTYVPFLQEILLHRIAVILEK